jgi:beta-lactam-binding protein with PASTA domain
VVPNVIGFTPQDAQARLEDFGFKVAFDEDVELEWDDPLDGKIAEQDPSAGQPLEFGATVTLRIGRTATQVPVPSVVGDAEAAAKAEIEAAGLVWAKGPDVVVAPGDSSIGKVINQDPTAGTTRALGSTVTISVGAVGAAVPNLFTGGGGGCPDALTQSAAQTKITTTWMMTTTARDEHAYDRPRARAPTPARPQRGTEPASGNDRGKNLRW